MAFQHAPVNNCLMTHSTTMEEFSSDEKMPHINLCRSHHTKAVVSGTEQDAAIASITGEKHAKLKIYEPENKISTNGWVFNIDQYKDGLLFSNYCKQTFLAKYQKCLDKTIDSAAYISSFITRYGWYLYCYEEEEKKGGGNGSNAWTFGKTIYKFKSKQLDYPDSVNNGNISVLDMNNNWEMEHGIISKYTRPEISAGPDKSTYHWSMNYDCNGYNNTFTHKYQHQHNFYLGGVQCSPPKSRRTYKFKESMFTKDETVQKTPYFSAKASIKKSLNPFYKIRHSMATSHRYSYW